MDNMYCLECKKFCKNEGVLHRHLKAHKMSQEDYYCKHFPRYDKLDNSRIHFKNKDWYFSNDFNTPTNLHDWLERVSKVDAQKYIRELLLKRKEKKGMLYTPCQVELKSLTLPPISHMDRLFGSYYSECNSLGFINKFTKTEFSGIWKSFGPEHKIICDSREQLPLAFEEIKTIHQKLDFGDYKLNDDEFAQKICIERKSINDFYGTMASGEERFEQEIKRAQNAGFYLIVLVEEPMEKLYENPYRINKPEYALHQMRTLIQKYPMIQFVFVYDRREASEIILKIFQSDGQVKNLDIQNMYDSLKLCGDSVDEDTI